MPWLFLAYPLLAHAATLLHEPRLAHAALGTLVAAPLWPLLRSGSAPAWLAVTGVTLILSLAPDSWTRYLMYAPPILLPLSVLFLFARSLRAGQVPLVTRVAARIRGELPQELARYTRHVTQCWVVILALMASGSWLLALFASPALWSWMTNVVQYLLLGAVFLVEYLYRRWRFRHLAHESFPAMVRALLTTRLH